MLDENQVRDIFLEKLGGANPDKITKPGTSFMNSNVDDLLEISGYSFKRIADMLNKFTDNRPVRTSVLSPGTPVVS